MKQQIQTYGKQNLLKREYNKVKSYYIVDPRVQELYALELYAPGIKRWKLSIGLILMGMCISTLGTNWMLPGIYRWMLK